MHLLVDACYFGQRSVGRFAQVLEPLADGVALSGEEVVLGVAHLGVGGNEQEEVLEVIYALHGIHLFRIVHRDDDVAQKTLTGIIDLAGAGVEVDVLLAGRAVVASDFLEGVVGVEVHALLLAYLLTDAFGNIGILEEVDTQHVLSASYAKEFHILRIDVDQTPFSVVDFYAGSHVLKDVLQHSLAAVQRLTHTVHFGHVEEEAHQLIGP